MLVCKHAQLCESEPEKCSGRCKTCPILMKPGDTLTINDKTVTAPPIQSCKHRNVIYLGQCQLCHQKDENTYGGKTMQIFKNRVNGHRGCFKVDNLETVEKSALSQHNLEKHPENFNLNNFDMMIYKKTNNPRNLHRLESTTISGLRTNVWGLNRMHTQKQ